MIFAEAPADFKKEVDVVGCYIEHAGRFVLLRRLSHKSSGGKLGLPAGKVDPGETLVQAMSREIREETGIEIPAEHLKEIGSVYVRHDGRDFVYHMFKTDLIDEPTISLSPDEHAGFVWATPGEALRMELVLDQDECIRIAYGLPAAA